MRLLVIFFTFLIASCGGGGGGSSDTPPSGGGSNTPTITVSLSSSSNSVEVNSSITLTWSSTSATSCSASGGWTGSKSTSGSESITIGTGGSNNFSLTCSAAGANSGSASVSVTGIRYLGGIAFDGYIRGATVFIDQNDNLIIDGDETSEITGNDGSFENLLYANGSLISIGGFDLDTGSDLENLTLVNKLEGFEETKIISPFTTLVAYMEDSTNLNQMLGVDSSINLMTVDPIPLLGEGIYDYMYEKGNQITVLSYSLQNYFDDSNSKIYFEAIASKLEDEYAENQATVDIEASSFVGKVIDQVEQTKNETIATQTKANLNTAISSVLPALRVNTDASITTAVQRFAFTRLQNDLKDSTIISNADSASLQKYQDNVYAYIASDQSIDESQINPNSNLAPVITSASVFSANENQTSIGAVLATDADGDSLTYSISGSEITISPSGVMTFINPPDFETKNSYSAVVTVSDGVNSVTQTISISILDIDETNPNQPPTITSVGTFSANENQTSIGAVLATDADGDSLTYSISGSEITISSSGVLTFVSAPDYETKNSYTATVTVSDGTDSVTQNITISITDINEVGNAPVFTSSSVYAADENQLSIGNVSATDADGDSLTYSTSGSEINISSSGVLTFASSPDYETKNSYTVSVTVSDGTNSTVQEVSVSINNLNDNSPAISSSDTFTANENQTSIGSVSASDADGDSLTYSISGSEITISSSGVLTFVSAPDYETKNSYTATVTVSDGVNSTNQNIAVGILDIAENLAPTISGLASSINVDENQTAVVTVSASDANGDSLSYSLTGTDSSSLSIDSSGVITFNSAPDYETKTSYSVTVNVSDQSTSAIQAITININNLNDNSPTISSSATFAVDENQTSIGSVTASDADGGSLTYSISGSSINISSSGVLSFASAPDYEVTTSFTETVTVSDGANSTNQSITVNINNVGGIYENGIAGAISTTWNKGVDFDKSGGNTFARVPEITNRYTIFSKSHSNSIATFQPWGTAITFRPDSTSTNQRLIQISSEDYTAQGSGKQAQIKDQGYLSIEGGAIKLRYRFYDAAVGDNTNVVQFTSNSVLTTGNWYSLFIYFDGDNDQGAFNSSAFKIYLVSLTDGTLTDLTSNGTWVETMSINAGVYNFWNWEDYEIGSENFDGIIAAFSATTYKASELPSNDEIRTMALDPIKWLNDYKVNSTYRTVFNRNQDPIQSEDGVFSLNSDEESYATQVFLMGDGGTDTASTIYNQVHTGGSANLSLLNSPSTVNISID